MFYLYINDNVCSFNHTFIICSSLLIEYATFTVFVSSVKTLNVLVSSIIISISNVCFWKIIDIIIVNNNVNGLKTDPWSMPVFIGKVSHCTSSCPTECLRLVEYYCVRCIAMSSIPMAPGYITDQFTLNYSVHDCHTCNCINILSRSTTCLQASVNLLTSLRIFGTLYTE